MDYYGFKILVDILMIGSGIAIIIFFPIEHLLHPLRIFSVGVLIVGGSGDLLGIYVKQRKAAKEQSDS